MPLSFYKSILLCLAICNYTLLIGQESFQVEHSEMTISGTSSLHDWVSDVTNIKVEAKLSLTDPGKIIFEKLIVTIPVEGIISSKGKLMDKKTYKALKSSEFPEIKYELKTIQQESQGKLIAVGQLTVAGQTKEINLAVGSIRNGNQVSFKGHYDLKMSDFKVETPTALMGTIKTGNDVTIDFELKLIPKGGLSK